MAQGNSQKRLRAGAKGTTPSSQITSTASGANHQAVDTVLYDTAGNPVSSFADVLPASTLPVATNKAVTVSQRDPLPTGTNTIGAISNTSFTANAGTNLNTSLLALDSTVAKDATLTGGNAKSIIRGGAKGATVAADITSVSVDANTQALHANITNFPATQPISAVSLPLPTGAATSALQTTQDTSINSLLKPASTLAAVTTVGAVTAITNALPTGANTIGAVTNTNLDVALSTRLKPADTLAGVTAVGSITSALPTGANSIGQVTANAGTNLNTSALALSATQTDGTQKAINRGGAKGATAAADVTSTNVDANTQALDVSVKGAITANLGTIAGVATETTLSAVNTKIPSNLTVTATRLLTDGSGVTQPVSGTFFQATQPVSAATLPLPTGASTEATLSALNTKVTAVNTGAVTISAALPTGANTIGAISNTSFIATQATPANLQATVTNLTLTKGTQGATGATVQNLKDAGRNQTNYFMAAQVLSTAIDALQSLTGYKGGIAVAATTTPAVVTATKTYRIQTITITYIGVLVIGSIDVNLRANLAGVVVIGSPLVSSWNVGANAAVAGVAETVTLNFPDGMEFPAGTGLGISVVGRSAVGVATATGYAKVAITGFEY